MNLFETVKQSVTTRQAAERYHHTVNRTGMMRCPFHDDRIPSMKVDRRFHCFGCGADGDVIDFVARLFDLDSKSAAWKLAVDFHLTVGEVEREGAVKHADKGQIEEQTYDKLEARCIRVLSAYEKCLRLWEGVYVPKREEETWHPRFIEALQRKARIGHLLDVLLCDPPEGRAMLIREYGKEVMRLERRLLGPGSGTEGTAEADGTGSALSND